MTFKDFGFSSQLMEGLDAMNYREPTPIQQQAIPVILEGKDLIASAQTGTGKTAAFLLPLLELNLREKPQHINTLVIVPTRELGLQIDQALSGLAYFLDTSSMAIYGGGDGLGFEQQMKALKQGCDMVIATPGKLLSHLNMGYVNMHHLRHLVLDEVDRMLDMGFVEDITRIIKFLPDKRQTLFFSATMPPKIRQLALKLLKNPVQINIAISKPAEGISQKAYVVYETQKLKLLESLFESGKTKSAIIFAGRKGKVKEVEKELIKMNLKAAAIHSDLEQSKREEVLLAFRNKKIKILVATDIVSRGIDVEGIDLVINYDVPPDPEDYVHRIGRTARAETTGEAISLVNEQDQKSFQRIERLIEKEIPKIQLPDFLGQGPVYNPELKRATERKNFPRTNSPGRNPGKPFFRKKKSL